jgi:hypothetical protein
MRALQVSNRGLGQRHFRGRRGQCDQPGQRQQDLLHRVQETSALLPEPVAHPGIRLDAGGASLKQVRVETDAAGLEHRDDAGSAERKESLSSPFATGRPAT